MKSFNWLAFKSSVQNDSTVGIYSLQTFKTYVLDTVDTKNASFHDYLEKSDAVQRVVIHPHVYQEICDYLYQLAVKYFKTSLKEIKCTERRDEKFKQSLLHIAITLGQPLKTIRSLIYNGYKLDAEDCYGFTALHVAIYDAPHENGVIEYLVSIAPPDLVYKTTKQPALPYSPLEAAAVIGDCHTLKLLFEKIPPSTRETYYSLCFNAALRYGDLTEFQVFEWLLKKQSSLLMHPLGQAMEKSAVDIAIELADKDNMSANTSKNNRLKRDYFLSKMTASTHEKQNEAPSNEVNETDGPVYKRVKIEPAPSKTPTFTDLLKAVGLHHVAKIPNPNAKGNNLICMETLDEADFNMGI